MYGYIYKTTNLVNGKIYIGQHRSQTFDKYYYGSGAVIKEAFKKYKPKRLNFKCEVLEWCETKEEISEREKYWVTFYNAQNPEVGYNLNGGGNGCHYGGSGMEGKVKIVKDDESKFVDFENIYQYLVDGWSVIDKAEAKRRAKQKWKKENKDKVRAQKRRYTKTHYKQQYQKHKKQMNEASAKYYQEHKEQLKQYYKEYYKDPEHRKAHAESSKRSRKKAK